MARPFESPPGVGIGPAAFCDPEFEDDPLHPGRQRVKRDADRNVVYTAESLARYERARVEADKGTNVPGGELTSGSDPVLGFYRTEHGYQKDAAKVRPKSGPFAQRNEIPKDVLKMLEKAEAAEKRR